MYLLISKVLNLKKGVVRLLVLFSLCVCLLSLIIPIAVQTIVNTLVFSTLKQPLYILVMLVVIVLMLAGLIRAWQLMIVENVQQTFYTEIALKFAELLPRLKLRELNAHRGPEIINRFFEVIPIQKSLSILLIYLIELGIQALTSFFLLAFYHPYLLVMDVILICCFILALAWPYRKAMRSAIDESNHKHKMVAWLEEYLHCANLFKFNNNHDFLLKKVDENILAYLRARTIHFKQILKHFFAFYSIYVLANAALLGIGGYLVLAQQLTLGQLVASEIVLNALVYSFLRISYYLRDIYALAASSIKINSVIELDYEPPVDKNAKATISMLAAKQTSPSITFDGISYVSKLGRRALDNYSLDINASDLICINFKSQTGKNLLLDILLGFSYTHQGVVRLNGDVLTTTEKLALRQSTYLLQEPEFFPGTLYENLTLNKTNISKSVLSEMFKQLDVLKDVESLPEGIQSNILSHRVDLSLGALYKLTLIRAVLAKPILLILDEVMDRLGVHDASVILQFLSTLSPRPTTIFTARNSKCHEYFSKVVSV